MLRFIDLRGQVMNDDDLQVSDQWPLFAFFDTITDTFQRIGGDQVWSDRATFTACYESDPQGETRPLSRFIGLMPEWVR